MCRQSATNERSYRKPGTKSRKRWLKLELEIVTIHLIPVLTTSFDFWNKRTLKQRITSAYNVVKHLPHEAEAELFEAEATSARGRGKLSQGRGGHFWPGGRCLYANITSLITAEFICFDSEWNNNIWNIHKPSLWSPYVIGQTIIFLSCFFFLLSSFFFLFFLA